MSSFLSNFLQDLAAGETPPTNAAQLASPINDEPSPTPRPGMPPPAVDTPMTDDVTTEPSTPKRRRKPTSNDHEPSPDFDSLSRTAKNKFRAIMRKRQGTSSETRMWYCRERCDWPFASQNERSYHERRCAVGLGDRRFSSKEEFERKIAGRSNEDVLSEWESLMQESARKLSGGGPVAAEGGGGAGGGGGDGGKEVEGEVGRQEKVQQQQQQRLAVEKNQALGGGLQHVGGKDMALREERSSSGVFSAEFILKYGAMQIEEKDARKATFAGFMAEYGAAEVEQAEPEVQVKVEDEGNSEIPLGENWWVPQ